MADLYARRRKVVRMLAVVGALVASICTGLQFMATDATLLVGALAGGILALVAALIPLPAPEAEIVPVAAPARGGDATARAIPAAAVAEATASAELTSLKKEVERLKALERELLDAKQVAEAATMAKGEFLATMSHEIRTPLNGIIPLLDLLLGSQLGPDQREYVQTAFSSAKQLLRIVDDILDYSKLEANKLELETAGLNLREVLQGVQKLLEKPAEAKGIPVHLQIDPSVRLAVRGDSVRLRQVLTNLVSNAVKFTDRGEVTIAVSKRGETRSQHDLRFEVRDTGIGISAEAAAKLFKPFSQADTSTTRTFGGTGLGLVICKRIVDLMGGQIGVDSELGKGSTFWFQVPMLKAVGDIGAARHNGLQGARILVLTTDPSLLRRFSTLLPQWGATPVPASTTQEAMNKLRAGANRAGNWSFQLLLADLVSVKTTAASLHRNLDREPGLDELKQCWLQGDEPPPAEFSGAGRTTLLAPRGANDNELRQLLTRFLEDASTDNVTQSDPEIKLAAPVPGAEEKLSGHVLLVEDNPVNRQVASRLLTLSGLTLDAAENGKEALDLLSMKPFAAILMDCQMPVMDGYTATRRRREIEQRDRLPHLPIIAMTANAMVGDREKCLEAGMDDYITKPLNRGVLEQTLRRWLPKPDSTATAAIGPATRPQPTAPAATPRAAAPTAALPPHAQPAPRVAPHAQPAPRVTTPPPAAAAPRPAAPAAAAPTPRPAAPVAPAEQRPAAPTPPRPAAPAPGAPAARPATASPAHVEPTAPAINRDIVEDLREIMGSEFSSLVNVFLEDAPRSLERLTVAAAAKDLDALVGPAHSLKSTSANLGAMELSAQAKHIEHSARQKNLPDAAQRVAALHREFKRAEQALRQIVG